MSCFALNPFPSAGLEVVRDPLKGRCFVATREIPCGTVLYEERVFVGASADVNDQNALLQHVYGENAVSYVDAISDFEKVASADTAKCLLMLIIIKYYQKTNRLHELSFYYNQDELTNYLLLLGELNGFNEIACIQDICDIREEYPDIIPAIITNEEAGQLLAILNTNQIELDSMACGGSALFVGTAIMEHSCTPNASFSSIGNTLYMTAIRDIAMHQHVSIDYGNNYYRPTCERRELLYETYGFYCQCELCSGIDLTRPFQCKKCKTGNIFPCGTESSTYSNCNLCQKPADKKHIKQWTDKEEYYLNNMPTAEEEITQILEESILGNNHYIIFWSINDLGMAMLSEARSFTGSSTAITCYQSAFRLLAKAYELLNSMIPEVHHERVVCLDRLAQICVALGERDKAKQYYHEAYRINSVCVGPNIASTQQLYNLCTNPPTSIAEMMAIYSNSQK